MIFLKPFTWLVSHFNYEPPLPRSQLQKWSSIACQCRRTGGWKPSSTTHSCALDVNSKTLLCFWISLYIYLSFYALLSVSAIPFSLWLLKRLRSLFVWDYWLLGSDMIMWGTLYTTNMANQGTYISSSSSWLSMMEYLEFVICFSKYPSI